MNRRPSRLPVPAPVSRATRLRLVVLFTVFAALATTAAITQGSVLFAVGAVGAVLAAIGWGSRR